MSTPQIRIIQRIFVLAFVIANVIWKRYFDVLNISILKSPLAKQGHEQVVGKNYATSKHLMCFVFGLSFYIESHIDFENFIL